jgi:hypothetical protein
MANVRFEYEGQVSSGGLNSWDRDSRKRVSVELDDNDLTVDEMLEEFMNFMKAIGYNFELGDHLEVVNDFKIATRETPVTRSSGQSYGTEELKIDFSNYNADGSLKLPEDPV